jgi:hypothetical protein
MPSRSISSKTLRRRSILDYLHPQIYHPLQPQQKHSNSPMLLAMLRGSGFLLNRTEWRRDVLKRLLLGVNAKYNLSQSRYY